MQCIGQTITAAIVPILLIAMIVLVLNDNRIPVHRAVSEILPSRT